MDSQLQPRQSRHSGFTLIECLTVLLIGLILSHFAVSSMAALVRSAQLFNSSNHFLASYAFARTEAIKQSRNIHLCVRNNDRCSQDSDWSQGWIIFDDKNNNGDVDSGETLRLFEPLAAGFELRPNRRESGLIFKSDGRVFRASGGLPLMTFRLCAPDAIAGTLAKRSREIIINAAGRPRIQPGREGITLC
jgi:prepilin-type N-terminal cleavage/methylation domain-containing protein